MGLKYNREKVIEVVTVKLWRDKDGINTMFGLVLPKKHGGSYVATIAKSRQFFSHAYQVDYFKAKIQEALQECSQVEVWFFKDIPYCKIPGFDPQQIEVITSSYKPRVAQLPAS